MMNLNIWSRVAALERQVQILGEKMASVQTGFTDLSNAITALSSEEASVVSAIAALQAQVAAGSPVTGDQLETLASQVEGVTAGLQAATTPAGTSTATSTATSS
jgi:uncharacterized protein involved in exopolysaccharide biosynthesis